MSFKKQKFNYDCDEATLMKIQALFGKSIVNAKDFQLLITDMISYLYEKSRGKKLK